MSGHFSRLNYDGCFIKEDTKQSTRPEIINYIVVKL